MQLETTDRLRRDCEIAAKFWGRTFSALGAMTYREKGEDAIGELWVRLLRQHQTEFYLQGLEKLGIDSNEPPAIKAAKYHYLTNIIGGLTMEYVEESPRKVWIRYTAPMWTYAGVTMLAIPGTLRRRIFTAWQPRNGALMGSRRLGWVSTKFIMEGDPCDEGYFIEHDRELGPGEEFRFEAARHTPEFDPAKAPRLDPRLWPEARILKARRNWSREYVRTTVDCLTQMYGEQVAHFLFRQVMRGLAIQFTHELKCDLSIDDRDARSVAALLFGLWTACGQRIDVETEGGTTRLLHRSFLPFPDDAGEGLRAALFEFALMAARLLNGRVAVTRQLAGSTETWEIADAGQWLW